LQYRRPIQLPKFYTFQLRHHGSNLKPVSESSDEANRFQTHRRENPPRPPSGSPPLPTIDASPLMIPNIWIKRTSKASHSIAGPDATKRLFTAQHKICSWIWNQMERQVLSHHTKNNRGSDSDSANIGTACTSTELTNSDRILSSDLFRELDSRTMKGGHCNLGFMLVGHGVPYQLLQDHVDCAWKMLNEIPSSKRKGGINVGNSSMVDDGEVVECIFDNDSKQLQFQCVQARTRDNVITHHTQSTCSNSLLARFNTNQELYLAVMNRISTTFGTILQTQPPPAPSSIINTDKYWKRDILNPMSCWRATFRRGFVYPPSATSTSFDSFLNAHDGKVKEGREFWTGPPIVELIPACRFDGLGTHKTGEGKSSLSVARNGQSGNTFTNTNFVRVTLQGIPSVFWQEQEECDSGSSFRVRKEEFNMIPLSLVFEACFRSETDRV